MITLYGIKNCDKVRKAKRWLDAHETEYHFHDWREDGVPDALLDSLLQQHGWEVLLNRRSPSWRSLPEPTRKHMNNSQALIEAKALPTLIKRPLLVDGDRSRIGFDQTDWLQFVRYTD